MYSVLYLIIFNAHILVKVQYGLFDVKNHHNHLKEHFNVNGEPLPI